MTVVSIDETTKRALAVESALFGVIMSLVGEGHMPPAAAIQLLETLASSSDFSRSKMEEPLALLRRMQSDRDKSPS